MSLKVVVNPISGESVARNYALLTNLRHVFALAGGAAAGALRLESVHGVLFYGIIWAVCTVLLVIISRNQISRFFPHPRKALLWDGILKAVPGYVLAWSLVYSLVET